ncbi:MAG TPA: hypothetical protein VLG50_03735 [Candidatus Saccharimonadales bacterium]|nr:hypothetical protein [Candidatus Saccharimonadales bacterium]
MIKKDDVMELHDSIMTMEKRLEKMQAAALMVLEEAKDLAEILVVMKSEYKNLKEKAGN